MTLSKTGCRAVRGLKILWARQRKSAEIARELEATSDRALAEMGVARGDIAAIALGRFPSR